MEQQEQVKTSNRGSNRGRPKGIREEGKRLPGNRSFIRLSPAPKDINEGPRPSLSQVVGILCRSYGFTTGPEVAYYMPWLKTRASVFAGLTRLRQMGVVIYCFDEEALIHVQQNGRGRRPRPLTLDPDILVDVDRYYSDAMVDEWIAYLEACQ